MGEERRGGFDKVYSHDQMPANIHLAKTHMQRGAEEFEKLSQHSTNIFNFPGCQQESSSKMLSAQNLLLNVQQTFDEKRAALNEKTKWSTAMLNFPSSENFNNVNSTLESSAAANSPMEEVPPTVMGKREPIPFGWDKAQIRRHPVVQKLSKGMRKTRRRLAVWEKDTSKIMVQTAAGGADEKTS